MGGKIFFFFGYKKETQHPSFWFLFFFLSHLHPIPISISSPRNFFYLYSATTPVPSRLTVLLSDSDISPRLHRLSAHRPQTIHLSYTAFHPRFANQPQIIFNRSNVQTCLQHKPSMPPRIPPSLLPCQENHLTTPLLWHTRSHMHAPSSHHRHPGPASTPRPCHLWHPAAKVAKIMSHMAPLALT